MTWDELLSSIAGKTKVEAHQMATAEYAIVESRLTELERVYKRKTSWKNPQLVEHLEGLKWLLSALDSPTMFQGLPDGYKKRQIQAALKTLAQS